MNEESKLQVGIIQLNLTDNTDENTERLSKEIEVLADQGAQLIVLQELHQSLYFCQSEDARYFDLAETIPGPSTVHYGRLAEQYEVVIVCSLFEKRAAGVYHNTAVVIDSDGSIAGTYRKMHIPDDPGFYEKFYFTPGDLGFCPIDTSLGRLGVLVCWDQWFPEAARLMAMQGAEVLIYPTAIGWDPQDNEDEKQRQLDAWVTVQRSHAIANGIPVISVNRCGFEPDSEHSDTGIDFWGNSFVAGPQGEFITHMDASSGCKLATLDMNRTEDVRRIWPFFRDRRIDAYQGLDKRLLD